MTHPERTGALSPPKSITPTTDEGATIESSRDTFLMTPEQHEARARQLCAEKSPVAKELAMHHEQLAKAIRKRQIGR